jgi:hypothetical protein
MTRRFVSVHAPRALVMLGLAGALSACGSSITTMTTQAMDSCIAARNPVFTGGHGADALKTPLAPQTQDLALRLRYARGFKVLKSIAENARDQVTLVCALDLMSYHDDVDVREFLQRYLKHPSPDVALNAKLLLDRPVPKGL